ncbi:unnamed protein product, partial [Amoebophrya sp. A25]|eukprot:GSA25T00007406001.1
MSSSTLAASSSSSSLSAKPRVAARILEVHLASGDVQAIEITEEIFESCFGNLHKPEWAKCFTVEDARYFLSEHYDPLHLCIPEMFDLYPVKQEMEKQHD